MKKVLHYCSVLVILMAGFVIRGHAQVAINLNGNPPDFSAMLDVSSTGRGLLIPRMGTADRIAIPAPAEGLLVYDTDTHSFWFFKSGTWSESLGSTSGWMLNGNSGTDSTSSFLGTTNGQALIFRTNNLERIHIGKTGLVGIGITNPSHNVHVAGGDVLFQRSSYLGDDAYVKIGDGFDAIKIYEKPSTTSWSTYITFDWNMGGATHGINWKQDGTMKWRLSASDPASFTMQSGSGPIMTLTDPDRYVGIGTTSPLAKLDVRGQHDGYAKILWPSTGPDEYDLISFSTPDKPGIFGGDAIFYMNPEEGIHLAKGGSEIQISQFDILLRTPYNDLIMASNGNIGINTGSTLPTNLLHVGATANPLRLEGLQANTTDNDVLVSTSTGVIQKRTLTSLVGGSAWSLSGNALTGTELFGSTNNHPVKFYSNNVERMRITEDGKVGIGLTNPTYPFQVQDSARFNLLNLGLYTAINVGEGFDAIRIVAGTPSVSMSRYIRFSSNFGGALTGITFDSLGVIKTGIYSNYQSRLWFNAQDLVMNAANHMIGIGTWNPTNKLHINSTANPLRLEGLQTNTTDNDVLVSTSTGVIQKRTLTSLVGGSAWSLSGNSLTGTESLGSTNLQPVLFKTNNSERMRISPTGEVGIGTADPQSPLHVVKPSHLSGEYEIIRMERLWSGGTHGAKSSFAFYDGNYGEVQIKYGQIMFDVRDINIGKETADMRFWTRGNGAFVNTMTITGDGKVGIGTVTPLNQLHVSAATDPLRLEGLQTATEGEILVTNKDGVVLRRTDGISDSKTGVPTSMTVSGGIVTALAKTTPAANTTITIKDGDGAHYHHLTFTNGLLTNYLLDTNP